MERYISISFTDGSVSSYISIVNHATTQPSQASKRLIIGILCIFIIFYQLFFQSIFAFGYGKNDENDLQLSLRKKCPYSELFWSLFFRIRTEYGEIRSIIFSISKCKNALEKKLMENNKRPMIKSLPYWDGCVVAWFMNDVLELTEPSVNEIETFMKLLYCVFMKSSNGSVSSIDAAIWTSDWTYD